MLVDKPQPGDGIAVVAIVEEVINKRRVGRATEFECRWTGSNADDTTWEQANSLSSVVELATIQEYERRQRWIMTECCCTRVSVGEHDEAHKSCNGLLACAACTKVREQDHGRGKRQRKKNDKFD